MRINLHFEARAGGVKMPQFAAKLLEVSAIKFGEEYQVRYETAMRYLFDREKPERLISALNDIGCKASAYDIDGLDSWGLLINDDDPVLVEYKLKYGEHHASKSTT